jgi:hypothetical protein
MFRKPTLLLPLAMLLGAVSAPALAQAGNGRAIHPHRHVQVSPYAPGSDAYGSAVSLTYANRQVLGEVSNLPWIQNPDSPRG